MVNFVSSTTGAWVAAGACVAGAGASVAGVPHAASMDMMVTKTVTIKMNFLPLVDMIIFSLKFLSEIEV
jgi:hypothetical protein